MAFTKITAAGIGSTETVTIDGLSVINDGSFGGNVSVGGTLTYEDVTNIDSVGLITARAGIVVGSGITLSVDGDGFFTGVVTATSYAGDGSALTGIDATQIVTGNTSVQTVDTGSDGHVKVNTEGSERLRITSDGKIGIGDDTPDALLSIKGDSDAATTPSIRLKDGTDTREAWITNSAGDLILNNGGDDNTPHCKITMMDANIIHFSTANTERARIDSSGHLLPATNDTYDLGSSSLRWRDIYTGDLNLSNEGKTNDVDGTWGNYTIQEGESDLFLINNRNGKKYKFNLTEVS